MYSFRKSEAMNSAESQYGLASPADRIAAGILDFSLLIPVVQLVQAPVKRWIFESILFDELSYITTYRVLNLIIFLSLLTFYMSLSIYWRGQTLGQFFIKIRVISYHGQLSLSQAFLRSVTLLLQIIPFGYPFLALWTHPLRRPIHDRVSDTLVISSLSQEGLAPQISLLKIKFAFSFVVLLFLTVGVISKPSKTLKDELNFLISEQCKDNEDQTLADMVELFIADKVSSSCLEKKAKALIWKDEDKTLAHFAVALALNKDKKKSDLYLSQSCLKDDPYPDELCIFVDWLKTQSLGTLDDPSSVYSLAYGEGTFDFIKIFVTAHLRMDRRYSEMEPILKTISKKSHLKNLHLKLSFHALLGQGKLQEAYWLMKSSRLINGDDLQLFLNFELSKDQEQRKDLLKVVDLFYPHLSNPYIGRGLASEDDDLGQARKIYFKIKEGL